MKKIQKLYLSILSVIILSHPSLLIKAGTGDLLKNMEGPGFEIINKAPTPIWVALSLSNDLVIAPMGQVEIAAGKKCALVIDTEKAATIGVYESNPGKVSSSFSFSSGGFTQLSPQPTYVYSINEPKKTKYLTWNPAKYGTPAKYFYPQTGILMGLLGKSDSGYPLSNNISASSIVFKK